MKKVLVAGATGYLGYFVVRALKEQGYWVRALGRSGTRLSPVQGYADELFVGDATFPESLDGLCDGIDFVFSSLGITRQKDGLSYRDVDYRANRNLLTIAERSGVSRFMYVHVLNADKMQHVALVRAKQAFVDELEKSPLDHVVICPTGFFSDMEEFLTMARSGRVFLFGDGSNRVNPIHGADLAEICVEALEGSESRIEVGGPEILTYHDIAELAFHALHRRPRITGVPKSLVSGSVSLLRWLAPAKTYGPLQFLANVMTMDAIGPRRGERRLADHFRQCVGIDDHKHIEDHVLPV